MAIKLKPLNDYWAFYKKDPDEIKTDAEILQAFGEEVGITAPKWFWRVWWQEVSESQCAGWLIIPKDLASFKAYARGWMEVPEECTEHVLGFDTDWEGGWLLAGDNPAHLDLIAVNEQFNFCPRCGVEVKQFWSKA